MSNEITPLNLPAMSTEELKRELAAQITITAQSLQRMGEIWHELERRGEDLSDLRSCGLYAYLPMVASGKLRAELVVRFAGKAMLLKALAALPIHQQDHLLATGKIEIASLGNHAAIDEVPLANVRAEHVRVVFGPSGIRTIPEQRRILKALEPAPVKRTVKRNALISIDPDTKDLRSGRKLITDRHGVKITLEDVLDALSAYYMVPLREIIEEKQGNSESRS